MSYVAVNGRNGWSGSAPQGLLDKLHEYNGKKAYIYEVAIGPNKQWAVVTSKGSSWSANNNSGFRDKMNSIKCCDIKTISFGPSGTWAIVMKDGFCHAYAFKGTDGPLDKITLRQNNIKYVSMSDNKGEWIVGYGKNGWDSNGCDSEMLSYVRGVTAAGTLNRIDLGRQASKWVAEATNGAYRFNFDKGSDIQTKYKDSRLRCIW